MNEYEHMEPIDGRHLTGLTPAEDATVLAVARGVTARTGTRCSFNVVKRAMLFHYGAEPFGGPTLVPITNVANNTTCIDSMANYINLGKMERAAKDRIAAQNERAEKQEAEKLGQQFREEIRPDVLQYAAYLDKRRRGTTTKVVAL